MAKRQNGEGSIFVDKNNKYTAKITYRDAVTGKLKQATKKNCRTEAEAKRAIELLREKIKLNGFISADSGDTLENLIIAVINEKKRTVWHNERLGTYTSSYKKNVTFLNALKRDYPGILGKSGQKVKYGDINSIVAAEMEKGTNQQSVREKLSLIREAFKHQIRMNNGVGNNPAEYVKVPDKYRGKKKPVTGYTAEELDKLIPVAINHQRWVIWALLLYMGLRPGEALALRWCDIDFREWTVTIENAVDSISHRIKETKTGDTRKLLIPEGMRAILAEAKIRYSAKYEFVAFNSLNPNMPIERRNLRKQWVRVCEKAGVGKTEVYALRHTFATVAEEKGIPKEYIAAYMGHRKLTTTEGYIDNYDEKTKNKNIKKTVEMLEKVFSVGGF